ncbi:protein PIF [Patella vulgata]|uniref:protein PIF n=1 Tax=Patella vulgata TaxID=6465 RepID=UPI00218056F3|nr:protein PIF [Patella vulgata]
MKEFILVLLMTLVPFNSFTVKSELIFDSCNDEIEVIVVLDGSHSISDDDFLNIKESLARFALALGIDGTSDLKLGVVVYGSNVSEVIPLSNDAVYLIQKINNITHPNGETYTHLGIRNMADMFLNDGNSELPQFGIVITDGASNFTNETAEEAQSAKDDGVIMFAIGVGDLTDQDELISIESPDVQSIELDNYDQLDQAINSLISTICPNATKNLVPIDTGDGGPCDGCLMWNGIGYNSHQDCDKYIQCEFTDDSFDYYLYSVIQCPFGTFWDQETVTCNHIDQVSCANDECYVYDISTYTVSDSCSEYYECVDGESKPRRCAPGSSFSSGSCVVDPDCRETGVGDVNNDTCYTTRIENEPCFYELIVHDFTFKLPCPPGTSYDAAECICTTANFTSCAAPECLPAVDIDFNSTEQGEYDNYGAYVNYTDGTAYFDGDSDIKILRLANVDFRSKIRIEVSYKPEFPDDASVTEAVVSNGDCGKLEVISIASNGDETVFSIENTVSQLSQISLTSTTDDFREVVYELNAGTFSAQVGTNSNTKTFPGLYN